MAVQRPPITAPIAEQNRFGKLFATRGRTAGTSTRFKGYRYVRENGEIKIRWMETTGTRKNAISQFRAFTNDPTSIPEKVAIEQARNDSRTRKEAEKVATAKAALAKGEKAKKYVYVLRFTYGKQIKILGAYEDEEKALSMAESLQEALVITEGEGEWTIDDVELK